MNNFILWIFLIAMIGNLAVFTWLILKSIFSKKQSNFHAYKLTESLKKELEEKGSVHFKNATAEVLVYTQEWVNKQKESINDINEK